jgi:hypothetical protein
MNHAIKDVIECKYTLKTFQERGYDEEVPIIGFAVEDLETVIKSVVHACAERVTNESERKDILSLAA